MLNKKELEKQGFKIIKIEGKDFLDLSAPKERIEIECPLLEAEQSMRNHFLETSQERGKALSILLPLVNQEDMTELLSELYDLRADKREKKAMDQRMQEVLEDPNFFKQINSIIDSQCRPTKTPNPKKQPKKKSQKK